MVHPRRMKVIGRDFHGKKAPPLAWGCLAVVSLIVDLGSWAVDERPSWPAVLGLDRPQSAPTGPIGSGCEG
jgi:hypothetical protein